MSLKILDRSADAFENASVYLDGEGDRAYKQAATVLIRRAINKGDRKLRSFGFANSKTNHLIQLADMIVGSINRYALKEKPDHDVYYPIIRKKIVDLYQYRTDENENKK